MRSISCHIMPLVINNLGGGHTNTHKYTHTDIHTKTILRNQMLAGHSPPHAWFKKYDFQA